MFFLILSEHFFQLRYILIRNQNNQTQIDLIKQKNKKIISEEMPQIADFLMKQKYQEAAQ